MRTRSAPVSPAVALNGIWALLLLAEVAVSLADAVAFVMNATPRNVGNFDGVQLQDVSSWDAIFNPYSFAAAGDCGV